MLFHIIIFLLLNTKLLGYCLQTSTCAPLSKTKHIQHKMWCKMQIKDILIIFSRLNITLKNSGFLLKGN